MLFSESDVRARVVRTYRSAPTILNEHITKQFGVSQHDIFLSHAYDDKDLVIGLALILGDLGYSVYIDWRDESSLDRNHVTSATAERLRERMKTSKCLFYSTTENASQSKWMPWELGYKDGHNRRAAIVPISRHSTDSYNGQEFLGVYPYVNDATDTEGKRRLWIHRSPTCYVTFDGWLTGVEPWERG
jgi:TIR domain